MYAGFAAVIAVFVWTYVGWLILLAGAQLAFYLQNPNYLRLGHAQLRLSGSEQERPPPPPPWHWTSWRASHRDTGRRGAVDRRAAGARAGAARRRHRRRGRTPGKGRPAGPGRRLQLFPGREISGIALAEIITIARTHSTGHELHPRLSTPAVRRLQEEMERAWRAACGTRTLADLLEPVDKDKPTAGPV